MRPHDGGVEDQVFEVRVYAQRGEKTLPNAFLSPPAETPEDAVPFAELFGQVTPANEMKVSFCFLEFSREERGGRKEEDGWLGGRMAKERMR